MTERQPPPEQECSLIRTTEGLKSLRGTETVGTWGGDLGVSGMEKSELWGWKVTSAGQFPGHLEVVDTSEFGL